jgi:hypothetical protein
MITTVKASRHVAIDRHVGDVYYDHFRQEWIRLTESGPVPTTPSERERGYDPAFPPGTQPGDPRR